MTPWQEKAWADWIEEHGPVCYLCGGWIFDGLPRQHPSMLTWDHVVPRNAGGHDGPDNMRPAHLRCNVQKANTPLAETVLRGIGAFNDRGGVSKIAKQLAAEEVEILIARHEQERKELLAEMTPEMRRELDRFIRETWAPYDPLAATLEDKRLEQAYQLEHEALLALSA